MFAVYILCVMRGGGGLSVCVCLFFFSCVPMGSDQPMQKTGLSCKLWLFTVTWLLTVTWLCLGDIYIGICYAASVDIFIIIYIIIIDIITLCIDIKDGQAKTLKTPHFWCQCWRHGQENIFLLYNKSSCRQCRGASIFSNQKKNPKDEQNNTSLFSAGNFFLVAAYISLYEYEYGGGSTWCYHTVSLHDCRVMCMCVHSCINCILWQSDHIDWHDFAIVLRQFTCCNCLEYTMLYMYCIGILTIYRVALHMLHCAR